MNDKITVQRANVVLDISPEQLDYYMSQGYDVINDRGDVVQASVPRDLGTLQSAYVEHVAKIEALEAEVEALKAETEALKAPKRTPKKKNTETD